MVSHDLLRLTVTNQTAFDRQDSNMFPNPNGRLAVVAKCWFPKLETPNAITFT